MCVSSDSNGELSLLEIRSARSLDNHKSMECAAVVVVVGRRTCPVNSRNKRELEITEREDTPEWSRPTSIGRRECDTLINDRRRRRDGEARNDEGRDRKRVSDRMTRKDTPSTSDMKQ